MVDLECMVKSLRLAWLKRFFSGTNGTCKSYLQHIVSSVGGLFFFNCNYNIWDYTIPSQFYQEILLWWSQFRETFATEEDWKTINQNNKEIKVENKPVYYKHFVNVRMICIQDLLFSSLTVLILIISCRKTYAKQIFQNRLPYVGPFHNL